MSNTRYIERGGEQVLAPPFACNEVQFFGYAVKADKNALAALCDKYLNGPSGTQDFVPAISHVLFAFNHLDKMYAKNPPDNDRGWYTETEAAIWMLVLDKKRHNLFWYQAYILVDDSYAMASGREIYGFPKQFASFDIPDGPKAPQEMSAKTVVVKELKPDCKATNETLFSARQVTRTTAKETHKKHGILKSLVEHITDALDITHTFLDHLKLDKNLFEDLIHLRIPMVFLKQFRDGAEPDKACYQAIQECDTTLTKFHDARVYFHQYEIEIGDFESHPIRSDFGFADGPLKVDVAFWVKFDFDLEVCSVVENTVNNAKVTAPKKKKKIAILGSGMSSVTTAMQLSEEGWKDRFESITMYQVGWRMGGKGTTGRGQNNSIEEHGLHFWLGYYENSFQLIKEVYKWAKRPVGSPMSTWRKAFSEHNYIGVNQMFEEQWHPWMFNFPTNTGTPGEGGEMPTLLEMLEMILGWLSRLHQPQHGLLGWIKGLGIKAGLMLGVIADESLHGFSNDLKKHAGKVHQKDHHPMLEKLLRGLTRHLEKKLTRHANHSLEERRLLILMSMGATIALGLLADGLTSHKDLEKLEGIDFSKWLKSHNALELVWNPHTSPLLRGMYDFAFAYEDGDFAKPNFAAAPALRTVFRMCLTYKGSVFWKMNAGMGDSIFAPAYEALINRGVKIEFFHKVTNLGLDDDKKTVSTIEMDVQATTKTGKAYNPLYNIDVPGGKLAVWPKNPLYDQLVQGEELEQQGVNLESFWTPWKGETKTLVVGEHFDEVVFGISLASVPYLCKELVTAKPDSWGKMVKNVATVRTQAAQLWLKPTIEDLGWKTETYKGKRLTPIIDSWESPMNTWADMTSLLGEEGWGEDQPGSLAYFCGPMAGGIPDPDRTNTPKQELAKVDQVVDTMLGGYVNTLWKNLGSSGLPSSDIRLRFCRANIDPSERYVMSLEDTAQYRLRADQSGFSNLVITGDWISNGYNAGCIEASAWSGIQAANAVLGLPLNKGVIS